MPNFPIALERTQSGPKPIRSAKSKFWSSPCGQRRTPAR
jgi:hypothetical protein